MNYSKNDVLIIKHPILSIVMVTASFSFLAGVAASSMVLKSPVCIDRAVAQVEWELNEDGSTKSGPAWAIVK